MTSNRKLVRALIVFALFAASTLIAVYVTEIPPVLTQTPNSTLFQCQSKISIRTTYGLGLSDGLIGYWPLNEGSGTIACDFSGNGNAAVLIGGPLWVKEKFGYALEQKTGDIGYALANISDFTFPFTMTGWTNKSGDVHVGVIFSSVNSSASANSDQCAIQFLEGGLTAGCWINGHFNYIATKNMYNDSQFHLVVFTANSTLYQLYVDGSKEASGYFSDKLTNQTRLDILGGYGRVAVSPGVEAHDIRVYDLVLTNTEIMQLYHDQAAPYG